VTPRSSRACSIRQSGGHRGTLVYSITPDDGTIFKFDHYGGPIIGNVFDSFYPGATNEKFLQS